MQLILDADDIDIKINMSTIEHESLSEKFHSNKIVEHLAEDISNGNKENIQKQNNIILEKPVDEDNSDTDKDTAKELSSNINGESPKEDSNVEDEIKKTLEEENEISNSEVQLNPECESHSTENKENKKYPAENSEINLEEQMEDEEQKEDEKQKEDEEQNEDEKQKEDEEQIEEEEQKEDEEQKQNEKQESDEKHVITQEKNTAIDGSLTVENIYEAEVITNSNNDVEVMVNKSDKIVDEDLEKETPKNEEACSKPKIDDSNISEYPDESTNLVTNSSQNTISIDVPHEDMKTPKSVCSEKVEIEVEDGKIISNGSEKNTSSDIADTEEKINSNCDEGNTSIEIVDEDLKTTSTECSEKNISNEIINENAQLNIDVDVSTKVVENNSESNKEVTEVIEKMDANDESNLLFSKVDVITEKEKEDNLEPKRICRLSNNLEIFSDEEDDSSEKHPKEPLKDNTEPSTEKQCISLDDDDDIMVIDEDPNTKDIKKVTNDQTNTEKVEPDNIEPLPEDQPTNKGELMDTQEPNEAKEVKEITSVPKETQDNVKPSNDATEKPSIIEPEPTVEKVEESQPQIKRKPLLPKNFIKSYKKNLADMTRDELEEFCILKIVESIVDRSNLGEIKSQLKNLTQTMEECKKKCLMLSKQNKDLQVVLKSVQEDQKSGSDNPITPLKITRSVGMQVVMVADKSNMRKRQLNGVGSPAPAGNNTANNKSVKSPLTPNTKTPKEKNTNNQPIPVPRLVPAVPAAKANQMSTVNNSPKQINTIASPNGLRTAPQPPPPKAAEKRPRSQSQSITVDLTDDEPPAKQQTVQRTYMNQTVRVPGNQSPSNIIATQRFGTNINSPRKVYIPISGAQAQNVRPGQPIMLKAVSGLPPRQRFPGPNAAKVPQAGPPMRLTKLQQIRHPAPLPEAAKQYQPSNWKSLPPAPDLKLSKVENGIVISWKIDNYQEDNHEQIASYQLYAYQETQSPPNTALWKKIGDVKALPLPMACTLTQFMAGYKYYFAVRAVDVKSRFGPFSLPGSILLLNKL